MMKKIFNFIYLLTILGFSLISFFTCNDADYSTIDDNRAYLKDADFNKIQEIFIENSQTYIALPINLTKKANNNVTVKIKYSEEVLKEFNEKYNKDYQLYPVEQWLLDSTHVNIPAGSSVGPLGLNIQPFTDENKESGHKYAIPVTIASVDGAGILDGSESFIYVLKHVPYADVPVLLGVSNNLKFKWNAGQLILNDFTVEFLVYLHSWSNGNNKAMFYAQQNGAATQIYTRLEGGSKGIKDAQFEVNLGGGEFLNARPPASVFEVGKWYHIAFSVNGTKLTTYINGVAVAQRDVSGKTINLNLSGSVKNRFEFGSHNVRVAEVRLWTISRTLEQLKENMYSVSPITEGLAAYWKLNEGSGKTYKDYTNKNDNASTDNEPTWLLNQRLEVQ